MKARTSLSLLVLAAVISLAASCAATDPGLTTKIKTKMAADDTVKAYQIDVTTRNGVVTLKGNIDSQEAKERALRIARETEGVVNVVDMIAVETVAGSGDAPEPDRRLGERIDDAGITMKVKARLLDDPVVKGLKVDVDTRDGVVFLTGSVASQAEKDRAVQIARETEGVRDVQVNLEIARR